MNADDPLRTTDHNSAPEGNARPAADTKATHLSPAAQPTVTFEPRDAPPDAPAPPLPAIAGYEILGVLGHGGMGVVYKARHLALKRTVALKMVLAGGHAGPRELARFRVEAEAVARLQHPNIVQIHDIGEADGRPYCALEFVEGGSLGQQLAGKPLPPKDAARLVEALARAMQLAHSRNVVHRDLKPANVLLTAEGTPKVTDFGLARHLDSDSGETQTGAVMGTPSYMAPEQASGRTHEAGPAADTYALGAILYACLAGRPPFKGETVAETLEQVRTKEPEPPSRCQATVPLDLDTICLKCLRKEPEHRYASAAELADDLGRFLRGEPIVARPVGRVERARKWVRRHKGLSAGLTAAVLALLVGTGVATWFAIEAGTNAERADAARQRADREKNEATRQLNLTRRHLCTAQLMRVAAVMERDPGLGLELLHDCHACPLDLRDFAWGWYEQRCRRERDLLHGQTNGALCVVFSGDGKLLASGGEVPGSREGEVKLWDVATGLEKASLKGHNGTVTSVAFSPDGKLLASASAGIRERGEVKPGEIRLWDVASGQETAALKGHTDAVSSVAFSPDGKFLASASADRTIKLWNVAAGKEKATLTRQTNGILSVAFSGDGKLLASGDGEALKPGEVQLWEVATGRKKATLKGHTAAVSSVAFNPDGRLLASAGGEPDFPGRAEEIKVWDVATGMEVASLKGHNGTVHSVAFSRDGKLLASGSSYVDGRQLRGEVKLWDVATAQEKATLKGHTAPVRSAAFSPDGKMLASASREFNLFGPAGEIKVWEVAARQEKTTLKGHAWAVSSVAFSGDGKLLASGSGRYDPKAKKIWGEIKIWDAAGGQEKATLKGHTQEVTSVVFSPDGRLLASGSGDSFLAGRSAEIKLWEVTTGQEKTTRNGHTGKVTSVAFSGDGKLLASGSEDRSVRLWDVTTGKQKLVLKGHTQGVTSVVFSPDGKVLASGSSDRTIKVWEVASGQEKASLNSHSGAVTSVAFSPDGKLLASVGRGEDERRILGIKKK